MDPIKRYSLYCGPATASAITGFTRVQCAKALRAYERVAGRKSRASTSLGSLIRFFETVGWNVEEIGYPRKNQVTLAHWLAFNDSGTWAVVLPGHVITVRNGEIVEDNGSHSLRSKVARAVKVTETPFTYKPANVAQVTDSPTCQTDKTHAKMELQQEISRKEIETMSIIATTSAKHQCRCSDTCPADTWRTFAQGHDARLVSRLRDAVMEHKMDRDEAYAELSRRAGVNGLHDKLDNAICNAMNRADRQANKGPRVAKTPKAEKAAKKVDTIEVDGFKLHANPSASEPNVERKVGRWTYSGNVTEHRIVGEDKDDTIRVFTYTDKKGNKVRTTKHANPTTPEVPTRDFAI